jgi:hypothetical protein
MTTAVSLRPLRILRGLCVKIAFVGLLAPAAFAQEADTNPFTDARDGGKVHAASGFVCPAKIGRFVRDAVGPDVGADFCAYSASAGVYGTIRLVPLDGPYDAKTSLAPAFVAQEALKAKRIADGMTILPLKPQPVAAYARTYETAALSDQHFRVAFVGAQFGNWAVETTVEYVDPRDTALEADFLHAVYAAAASEIAGK